MTTKRIAAAFLWFVTGWMLGAMAAFAVGLPTAIAPALGVLSAILVVADPAGFLWSSRTEGALRTAAQMDPSGT